MRQNEYLWSIGLIAFTLFTKQQNFGLDPERELVQSDKLIFAKMIRSVFESMGHSMGKVENAGRLTSLQHGIVW